MKRLTSLDPKEITFKGASTLQRAVDSVADGVVAVGVVVVVAAESEGKKARVMVRRVKKRANKMMKRSRRGAPGDVRTMVTADITRDLSSTDATSRGR